MAKENVQQPNTKANAPDIMSQLNALRAQNAELQGTIKQQQTALINQANQPMVVANTPTKPPEIKTAADMIQVILEKVAAQTKADIALDREDMMSQLIPLIKGANPDAAIWGLQTAANKLVQENPGMTVQQALHFAKLQQGEDIRVQEAETKAAAELDAQQEQQRIIDNATMGNQQTSTVNSPSTTNESMGLTELFNTNWNLHNMTEATQDHENNIDDPWANVATGVTSAEL